MTLLVCSDHVTTREPFKHDVKRGVQGFEPLTWDELRYLARAGFEVGAHTASHFDCGSLDSAMLNHEIVGAKAELERHLGLPVKSFSFPWGFPANVSPQALEMARTSYERVLIGWGGVNYASPDGQFWRLSRSGHCRSSLELELRIQSILGRPGSWRWLTRTADWLGARWMNITWARQNPRLSAESESEGA